MRNDAGLEVILVGRDGFQSLPMRHDLIVWIGFSKLSFGVDGIDGEIARPAGWHRAMEVEIGIEGVGIEIIDGHRIFLWDMAVAHGFTDDCTALTFRQRVVIRLARS